MRRVEDILTDMQALGLSPETIDSDILAMQRDILVHVVSIDERMSDEQVRGAFKFVTECHKRHPIDRPVSIKLNDSGGVILNRGSITNLDASQVAEKHKARLLAREPSAMHLNRLLTLQSEETG
ncbi:hypothetical protein P9222_08950 [Paenibacillus amylolyticus]|nr:hypothetical protein [Paenibacillus amylolyticus]WFR64277.1 hypothetical protein P9222_08950 [Paenibacillus amylolyticus]